MTRADRIRTMADGYVSPAGVRHVLADTRETACGYATVYPAGREIDSHSTCWQCVEAVLRERTRYNRAARRAALRAFSRRLRNWLR